MTKSSNLRHVERCLKATGLPWEIVQGSKHMKIILAGKFIGVLSNAGNGGRGRSTSDAECAIKRRLKELKCSS